MLTLSEELYLALHFNKKEGVINTPVPKISQLITAGGLVVELLLAGRLRLEKNELVVVDTSLTGEKLLDETLYRLQPSVRFNPNDGEWFNAIAKKAELSQHLLARLIEKGVIRPLQKRKWFGLSQTTVYPLQDKRIVPRWQQLQEEVLLNGGQPSVHDAILLFMTYAWNTPLPADLSRREQKVVNASWERIFGDYWGAYPVVKAGEPILGLDPIVRNAIGQLTVSWATVKAMDDASRYASVSPSLR